VAKRPPAASGGVHFALLVMRSLWVLLDVDLRDAFSDGLVAIGGVERGGRSWMS
jgi:hypothetical protein